MEQVTIIAVVSSVFVPVTVCEFAFVGELTVSMVGCVGAVVSNVMVFDTALDQLPATSLNSA